MNHPPDVRATEPWQIERLHDFDALWQFVDQRYAFFDTKATDWAQARQVYRPLAVQARERVTFVHVLEGLLDELYDPHVMLNTNADDSWRPVPNDVYVEEQQASVYILAVKANSAAEKAGLRVGQEVLSVNGVPIAEAANRRLPKSLSRDGLAAKRWALLSAVGGQHGRARTFQVTAHEKTEDIVVPAAGGGDSNAPPVSFRMLDNNIGLVRINTFADEAAVAQFDRALEKLRSARALLIDVRDNPGGDTLVAKPIMGRLITEGDTYALMARREGAHLGQRWPERVEPRGPWAFTAPVVILVDRFSASMAEGFAMGLQSMHRAKLVGTRMTGLDAAIGRIELPSSHISAQISTEPIYRSDGTPRSQVVPDVLVDVLIGANTATDPIFEAARREADRLVNDVSATGASRAMP